MSNDGTMMGDDSDSGRSHGYSGRDGDDGPVAPAGVRHGGGDGQEGDDGEHKEFHCWLSSCRRLCPPRVGEHYLYETTRVYEGRPGKLVFFRSIFAVFLKGACMV